MADKGKRVLEADDKDESQPKRKRRRTPTLASVFAEAMRANNLRRLFAPVLRKMVREEVERVNKGASRIGGGSLIAEAMREDYLQGLFAPVLQKMVREAVERANKGVSWIPDGRNWPKAIEEPDGRNLQLRFRTRLSITPLFTGNRIEGENGNAIHVMLLDAKSGQPVRSGPEASAKLDVVVLDGQFNKDDDDNWTEAEFQIHIVKEREQQGPLLVGDLQVSLKDGTGTLGKLSFSDSSFWTKNGKFRLGLKIASGCCQGIRIREAKTEAFVVKDRRGELYKKHYPPALKDEVWRLEKIAKNGSFHNKLRQNGIKTVEEFLICLVRDPERLLEILGDGMKTKMRERLINHAKTCTLSDNYYIYYQDESKNTGAIFNVICEFQSLTAGGQFYSAESLRDDQKDLADKLIKNAYNNWGNVVEYDARDLVKYMENKKATESERESLLASSSYPAYNQPVCQFHPQSSVALDQEHSLGIAGAVEGGPMAAGDFIPHIPIENPSFVPQDNSVDSAYQPQLATNEWVPQNTILLPSFDHPFVEDPHLGTSDDLSFCFRSHEMLEFDDMSPLSFSMGGASTSFYDSGFAFSPDMTAFPDCGLDDERSHRTVGKSVVGWLKIKAAMRWGAFIRKKAAERSAAQLVELVE